MTITRTGGGKVTIDFPQGWTGDDRRLLEAADFKEVRHATAKRWVWCGMEAALPSQYADALPGRPAGENGDTIVSSPPAKPAPQFVVEGMAGFKAKTVPQPENRPVPGKQYALTGRRGAKCISNGSAWAESEVKPVDGPKPAALLPVEYVWKGNITLGPSPYITDGFCGFLREHLGAKAAELGARPAGEYNSQADAKIEAVFKQAQEHCTLEVTRSIVAELDGQRYIVLNPDGVPIVAEFPRVTFATQMVPTTKPMVSDNAKFPVVFVDDTGRVVGLVATVHPRLRDQVLESLG